MIAIDACIDHPALRSSSGPDGLFSARYDGGDEVQIAVAGLN
ncbi:MAG: hypothetical protein ACOC0P_07780 [Planctomycetota bacterium]